MLRGFCLEGAGQNFTGPPKRLPLILGHNQEFKPASQAFAVACDGAHSHEIGRNRNRKLHGNNFPHAQFSAEGGSDAILS